jgi:hypothetical protein
MAGKKEPPKGPGRPKQEPGGGDDKRPRHRPEGREHEVHKEILERRWRGGPKPTPEHYRRALEQWKNLPGSIVRPPTDVGAPSGEKSPNEQQPDTSARDETQGSDKGGKP